MDQATTRAFLDELYEIEKAAGVRDSLKLGTNVVRRLGGAVGKTVDSATFKTLSGIHKIPGGKRVLEHVTDPINIADLSSAVGTIGRLFK